MLGKTPNRARQKRCPCETPNDEALWEDQIVLRGAEPRGAFQRGGCNFYDKVLHAQQGGVLRHRDVAR